jgi:hypothetical protein
MHFSPLLPRRAIHNTEVAQIVAQAKLQTAIKKVRQPIRPPSSACLLLPGEFRVQSGLACVLNLKTAVGGLRAVKSV